MRKSLLATYVKIFIVIIVIVGIVYLAYRVLNKEYSQEEFETVKTNLLLIQGKTEVISQKVEIEEEGAEYIGTKIQEKENDEKIQNLINIDVINLESEDNNYYCIDNSNLAELGLENISIDDYYIVDYKQNDVIYVDGIENENGDIVYKLSEMLQLETE